MEIEDTELENESEIECQAETGECNCPECQCGKRRYVHIIDYDAIIDNLNDWD